MENLKEALCKERNTFLAGAENQKILQGALCAKERLTPQPPVSGTAEGKAIVVHNIDKVHKFQEAEHVSLPLPPSRNGMPSKVSMSVVKQIIMSPGLLNFNRFSPHAFHLDKKVEVFAAEASPNHEFASTSGICGAQ